MPNIFETADAAAGTATAYALLPGQTAQGQLTGNGDHDWYKVRLVAGQTYSFAMTGTGAGNVQDTFLRLYSADGVTLAASDDDSLPGRNSVFVYAPAATGDYYVDAAAFDAADAGQYGIAFSAGARPSFDIQMSAGVMDGDNSWSAPGAPVTVTYGFRMSPASYTASGSNISTFTALTETEKTAVRLALQFWSDVSGLTFTEVNPGGLTDNAAMLFANYSDPNDGAGAFAYGPGATAGDSAAGDVWLNTGSISTDAPIPFGSYSLAAILHEIGHAIGLSHPGAYNAAPNVSITYAANAQFTQDSQQYSIMSYFDESATGAQYHGSPDTPMLSDVHAIQQIYGANTATRAGNTTYGFGTNAGAVFNFATNARAAFCIWDGGGADTVNASGFTQNQTIDLNQGAFSSTGAETANISIALGAVIENAVGGSGNDTLTGNSANNALTGGLGGDTLSGGAGGDALRGGSGVDTMNGGDGNDRFFLDADSAADTVAGEAGSADSIDLYYAASGATVAFGAVNFAGAASGGGLGTDSFTGIERVYGSNFADTVTGGAGNEVYALRDGADVIDSGGGADRIDAGAGADRLRGGLGADVLTGGLGDDAFVFFASDFTAGVSDTILDFHEAAGADFDHLSLQGAAAGYSFTAAGLDVRVADLATGGAFLVKNFSIAQLNDQISYF